MRIGKMPAERDHVRLKAASSLPRLISFDVHTGIHGSLNIGA
jgi:hypothetical protein